jgi:CheY-like chemotaxis protein
MATTILIADDESHILNVVSLKLRNAGYDVVTASDGGEALLKALELQPALLITDFHMPVLDGLEVCRRLKQHRDGDAIPAIMLTARSNELSDEEMRSSGIVQVVSKPFSPRLLLAAVTKHLPAA